MKPAMISLYLIYSYVSASVWWRDHLGNVESFLTIPNMPGFHCNKVVRAPATLHQHTSSVTTVKTISAAGSNGPLVPHMRPCPPCWRVEWMGDNPPNKQIIWGGQVRKCMAIKALLCSRNDASPQHWSVPRAIVVGWLYFVQYKGIFGTPGKGQTLYVWWGQTVESGLRCWAQHLIEIWGGRATTSSPHHCQDSVLHSYVGNQYWTDQTCQN